MNKFNLIYIQILKNSLAKRVQKNPSYSLRAFANMLGTSAGSLSAVINGKRTLTLKKASIWAEKLDLTSAELDEFLGAVTNSEIVKVNTTEIMRKKIKKKYDYHLM